MGPQVEVISGVNSWRFALEADRTSVGKAPENDIPLTEDPPRAICTRCSNGSPPAGA